MRAKLSWSVELQKLLFHELIIVIRFGLVGIVATAIHILTLYSILSQSTLMPLLANTVAYLAAFGFSFVGNYVWTFRAPGNPVQAVGKFFIISIFAFSINTIVLAGMLRSNNFSPLITTIFAALIVPTITFFGSRCWGFQVRRNRL
jgi:putative flippase GtrA